ncbi:hypothetical protein D0N87_09105 [Pseudomonas sp. ATCC 13867]|nr:hypothetical protein D0N87_09105 [Pseudomonas sp. ATCC 13867]
MAQGERQRIAFRAAEGQLRGAQFAQALVEQQAREVPVRALAATDQQVQRRLGQAQQTLNPGIELGIGGLRVVVQHQPERLPAQLQGQQHAGRVALRQSQATGDLRAHGRHAQRLVGAIQPDARATGRQALQGGTGQGALAIPGRRAEQAQTTWRLQQDLQQRLARQLRSRHGHRSTGGNGRETGHGDTRFRCNSCCVGVSAEHSGMRGTIGRSD